VNEDFYYVPRSNIYNIQETYIASITKIFQVSNFTCQKRTKIAQASKNNWFNFTGQGFSSIEKNFDAVFTELYTGFQNN